MNSYAEAHLEPIQTSNEAFCENSYSFNRVTIFAKNSILDIYLGSEYPLWLTELPILTILYENWDIKGNGMHCPS